MNLTVHAETYDATAGTVEVTINADRRAVRAHGLSDGTGTMQRLHLSGLAVRFRTGAKVWPGSACFWFKGAHVNSLTANIDKRGSNGCHLVGYFSDFAQKPAKSRHNAVRATVPA